MVYKQSVRVWVLFTCLCFGCLPTVYAQQRGLAKIDSVLARFRVDHPDTRLAFGLVEGDRTATRFFGSWSGQDVPDSTTRFSLGRLTSLWATALAVEAARDGLLSLDAPVTEYLPVNVPAPVYQRLVCQPVQATEQAPQPEDPRFTRYACLPDPSDKPQPILLCYLLTHTSGLPDQPFTLERSSGVPDYAGFTTGSLYKFLSIYRLEQPIGFDYAYSDLGIVLLAHVVQRRSGRTIDALFEEKIARPLGLTTCRLRSGTLPGEYGMYGPAIGGEAGFSDMLRFLRANLQPAGATGQVLEYMHAPRMQVRPHDAVALGWHCRTFDDNSRRILYMQGKSAYQHVWWVLDETGKSGFVLAGHGPGIELLGESMISLLYSHAE